MYIISNHDRAAAIILCTQLGHRHKSSLVYLRTYLTHVPGSITLLTDLGNCSQPDIKRVKGS